MQLVSSCSRSSLSSLRPLQAFRHHYASTYYSSPSSFSSSCSFSSSFLPVSSSLSSRSFSVSASQPALKHAAYDILIVGGGMVGTSLGALLACLPNTQQLRIAILDRTLPQAINLEAIKGSPPNLRVSAISPASAAVLEKAGVWPRLRASHRLGDFREMQVWDTFGRGRVHWKGEEFERDQETKKANQKDPNVSSFDSSSSSSSSSSPSSTESLNRSPLFPSRPATESRDVLGFTVENDLIVKAAQDVIADRANSVQGLQVELVAPVQLVSITNPQLQLEREQDSVVARIARAEGAKPYLTSASGNADVKIPTAGATVVHSTEDWVEVKLSNGQVVRTRLLIGADGANSAVRRLCELGSWGWDYHQRGVLMTVKTETAHATAWQRFLPTGPVAALPCFGNYTSIIWSTTLLHAQHISMQPPATQLRDLNNAFRASSDQFRAGGRPSPFAQPLPNSLSSLLPVLFPEPVGGAVPPLFTEVVEPPQSFPLRLIHSTGYTVPRVALIGDAAHVIHPLAGQGVNLGLADAAQLVELISEALFTGQEIGNAPMLAEYERNRRAMNLMMMGGVDFLQYIFSIGDGPLALLRNVGLDLFNSIPELKTAAGRLAMGVRPDQVVPLDRLLPPKNILEQLQTVLRSSTPVAEQVRAVSKPVLEQVRTLFQSSNPFEQAQAAIQNFFRASGAGSK